MHMGGTRSSHFLDAFDKRHLRGSSQFSVNGDPERNVRVTCRFRHACVNLFVYECSVVQVGFCPKSVRALDCNIFLV